MLEVALRHADANRTGEPLSLPVPLLVIPSVSSARNADCFCYRARLGLETQWMTQVREGDPRRVFKALEELVQGGVAFFSFHV